MTSLLDTLRQSALNKLRIKIYNYLVFSKLVSLKQLFTVIFTTKPELTIPLKNGVALKMRTADQTDISVAGYVFVKAYHVPPFPLPEHATIIDLGSNIGCTIIDYSLKYPNARVFGVEMDSENFRICKENITPFKNATVSNHAIWSENGLLRYSKTTNTDAYTAMKPEKGQAATDLIEVESIRISSFLEKNNIHLVDFMKIDIEGAEHEIFHHHDLSWLHSVKALHIEIHEKDWIKPMTETLEKFNFTIIPDKKHWSAFFAKKS